MHCAEQIDLLEEAPPGKLTVWLKFDTGMNRLGFSTEEAEAVIGRLRSCDAVGELRLMSHLASADELDNPMTEEQFSRFREVVEGFEGAVSIANTPATLGWSQVADAEELLGFEGDHWIRPGLALFGISPFAGRTGSDLQLKPVMRFEARLISKNRCAKAHVSVTRENTAVRRTRRSGSFLPATATDTRGISGRERPYCSMVAVCH